LREFLSISKALGDENRLRALLALQDGELCLCHIIQLLELAPATLSKHMDLLVQAGLVERRKEGRWCYFRLPVARPDPRSSGPSSWRRKRSPTIPWSSAMPTTLRKHSQNRPQASECVLPCN